MSVEELILKFNSDLINKKEELNEEINDIIYGDMERKLTINDIVKINKIRKQINSLYEVIEYTDKKVEEFMED